MFDNKMETDLFKIDEKDVHIISRKRNYDEGAPVEERDFSKEDKLNPMKRMNDILDDSGVLSDASFSDLGVDEAVFVRTRRPVAKLDDEKLLSPKGLVWIFHNAPQKICWKGRGHEFYDLRRLLLFYQVWAHELFPKARFREILRMIQKHGHSKRIRVARLQWIRMNREELVRSEDASEIRRDELEINEHMFDKKVKEIEDI
ncbi:hypothetical protein PNEG_02174 [Pneumocystis murina B123]|uniref:Chromosome segregation in meiosis protein n=1 Tax=Pneumocystis murina (strain B123) TaxID=1069680 RepID=M7P6S6_PNEMU|nr:hypothetical protein PNEG_02174 [Pneumocystis murina B123]EMR09590.1 hypothetical protein PNEG_02174 [Pneumocystis murina B123]